MRWYSCFFVVVLLPSAVLMQETLDENTKNWLATILPNNNLGNKFESNNQNIETNGSGSPNANTDILDPNTTDWLNGILGNPDTTTSSSTTTTASPANTGSTTDPSLSKFNNPDLDPDFNDSQVCTTDNGEPGLCVSRYQCKNGLIDNTTLIDLRDGQCPHYLQTCCLRSEASKAKPVIPPLTSACGWGNPGAGIFRAKDAEDVKTRPYADYAEYPWMVALLSTAGGAEWKQSNYYGGGSIIHRSVVITIAHKVDWQSPRQIKCRAGEWDTNAPGLYPTQERDVKKIIIHEEYYRTPAINDVALLILASPFTLEDAPHIGVACLAPNLPAPGQDCYSMGWGKDFLNKNKYAVVLKKVQLSYVQSDNCQAQLQRTRLGPRYTLHSSHLCAGGVAGVDTCKGDGGSPLVCPIAEGPDSSRFAVYGMVAFGVDCGKAVPGVYVNVPKIYSWVDAKMNAEGFGTSSYKY